MFLTVAYNFCSLSLTQSRPICKKIFLAVTIKEIFCFAYTVSAVLHEIFYLWFFIKRTHLVLLLLLKICSDYLDI
jgi:hypothetical protein